MDLFFNLFSTIPVTDFYNNTKITDIDVRNINSNIRNNLFFLTPILNEKQYYEYLNKSMIVYALYRCNEKDPLEYLTELWPVRNLTWCREKFEKNKYILSANNGDTINNLLQPITTTLKLQDNSLSILPTLYIINNMNNDFNLQNDNDANDNHNQNINRNSGNIEQKIKEETTNTYDENDNYNNEDDNNDNDNDNNDDDDDTYMRD